MTQAMRTYETGVLVVDTEPLCRWALREALREVGFQVADSNGEHLPDCLDGIDVLVLDATLPGGGALTVLQRVRASNPRCRVLLLTELDDVSLTRPWPQSTSWQAMQKPFDIRALVAAVTTLADRSEGDSTVKGENDALLL